MAVQTRRHADVPAPPSDWLVSLFVIAVLGACALGLAGLISALPQSEGSAQAPVQQPTFWSTQRQPQPVSSGAGTAAGPASTGSAGTGSTLGTR